MGTCSTTEEFIKKSKLIHGDKFDYSKTIYVSTHKKVIIICPIHKEFEQTPDSHLSGRGCLKCKHDSMRLPVKDFIARAIKLYGDMYDYAQVKYNTLQDKIKLTCNKHNLCFIVSAQAHLLTSGCVECAKESFSKKKRLSQEEFIKRSDEIHNNKYTYNKVVYLGFREKVIITCPYHGDFAQFPSHHLSGCGCPKCSSSRGELNIAKWLNVNDIIYIPQKKFDDCRDTLPLVFDFYLPGFNIFIEYDGEQHYSPISFHKSQDLQKEFENTQRRDSIKNKYTEVVGGLMFRIRFDEDMSVKFNELKKIIEERKC